MSDQQQEISFSSPKPVLNRGVKREIEITGRDDCQPCVDAKTDLPNQAKDLPNAKVEFIDLFSDKGQEIDKTEKIDYTPFIKDCITKEDGTKLCRKFQEYKKDKFSNLKADSYLDITSEYR